MSRIRRHVIEAESARARDRKLARLVEDNLTDVADYPGMLESVQRKSLLRTRLRLAFDPTGETSETHRAIALAGTAGSAFFACAGKPSGTFSFTVRDRITLSATGPTMDHNASVWLESLWSCLVTRDVPAAGNLCTFPVDVLRSTDTTFPSHVYS